MPKRTRDDSLIQIVETQAALRASIEKARELADESDRLIRKHRDSTAEPELSNPQPRSS